MKKTLLAFVIVMGFASPANAILVAPSPYHSFNDSLFNGRSFSYFHLEDFEDHLLNTPGVSASGGGVTSAVFGPTLHDSVDGDDGLIDGSGLDGDSYFSASGSTGISFAFDSVVLGSLPTAVGIVWTDGNDDILFEAFDSSDVSLGKIGPIAFSDGSFDGGTAEDRLFGIGSNPTKVEKRPR